MPRSLQRITKDEPIADNGMVAATHPLAAEAGLEVLRQGGNAVDAAVATAFTLAVVEPHMCGIGGGGLMVFHQASTGHDFVIDFAMDAPMSATPDAYELADESGPGMFGWRRVKDDANQVGYRAAAIPGTVAGLSLALDRFGTIPLRRAVEPAIRYAEEGAVMHWGLSLYISICMDVLTRFPSTASVFLPTGFPLRSWTLGHPADRLLQPDLARTLRLIAERGPEGFYQGQVARTIARAMAQHGGLIAEEDLAQYQATIHEGGLSVDYRGHRVVGAPGATGCVTALQGLSLLEGFDLGSADPLDTETLHPQVEAFRQAFADRYRYVADPNQIPVPWKGLLSKQYAAVLRKGIALDRAAQEVEPGNPWAFQEETAPGDADDLKGSTRGGGSSTTHLCAVDRERNAVSLTFTLVDPFGSGAMVPETGVLLNNAMQWFDPEPGHPNSIAPGKRGLHNMTPLLVLKNSRPLLAIGALGGRRIINAVTQVVSNVVDHHLGVQDAIAAPRIDCSTPDLLLDSRIPEPTVAGLRGLGHRLQVVEESLHAEQFSRPLAILIDPETGRLHGGVDPLRPGIAVGC